MNQPEQPWQPGPNDLPFTTHLINPHGDRRLGFMMSKAGTTGCGSARPPSGSTPATPSINQIISYALIWVRNHPDDPRGYELIDEVAAGAKGIVMHFAQAAQATSQG
ncbi:hypothetical protein EDD95_4842 [Streptomyces sp. CEV 2-1]|uniref:hypothetical protein n=1 Tax=Streptomyces sp. CEV 2-1 TaxID=2485153 RepID=UPI000F4A4EB5|nr:hypothetical protein [Streptomyces sp. CEV 2-1]ROQ78244.1 hypothetical protein EDD95_4842 [Streptomyces sp. CEV 2-1]